MEKMSWIAELIDRLSPSANRMTRNLAALNAQTTQGRDAMGRFTAVNKPLQAKLFGSAGESINLAGALSVVKWAALAAGAAVLGAGYAIGKTAFENFAFKESALATGKALWGSAEAADAMFKKATQLAKLTPFNVAEAVSGFNKLGAAGFGAEEVPVVFQGLSDIAAMSGRGAEAISSLTLAFSQMMGKGHLMGQELNQITEAAGGAVSSTKLFAKISTLMGREVSFRDMEAGLIDSRTAIMGVMQIAKEMGGGIIGQNSIEQSKTLGGLLSNLQDVVTNLWLTMDLTNKPWFKAVKAFMGGLVEALDSSSRAGAHVQAVFDQLFGETIGRFLGDGSRDMGDTIIQLADAFQYTARQAIAAFSGLWEGLKAGFGPLLAGLGALNESGDGLSNTYDLFHAIGTVIGDIVLGFAALAGVVNAIVTPLNWLGDVLQRIWDLILGVSNGLVKMIGGGLVHGLTLGFVDASDVMEQGADNLVWGFKRLLGIQSPSKVFEDLGEQTVAGFNQGVARTPGMDASLGEELVAGGRGGVARGGGVSLVLTINVNGAGADGRGIAELVRSAVLSELAGMLDQAAMEKGLA